MEDKLNFQSYPIWQEVEGINHYTHKTSKNVYLKDISVDAISNLSNEIKILKSIIMC